MGNVTRGPHLAGPCLPRTTNSQVSCSYLGCRYTQKEINPWGLDCFADCWRVDEIKISPVYCIWSVNVREEICLHHIWHPSWNQKKKKIAWHSVSNAMHLSEQTLLPTEAKAKLIIAHIGQLEKCILHFSSQQHFPWCVLTVETVCSISESLLHRWSDRLHCSLVVFLGRAPKFVLHVLCTARQATRTDLKVRTWNKKHGQEISICKQIPARPTSSCIRYELFALFTYFHCLNWPTQFNWACFTLSLCPFVCLQWDKTRKRSGIVFISNALANVGKHHMF